MAELYCRFICAAVHKILVEYLSQTNTVNTSTSLFLLYFGILPDSPRFGFVQLYSCVHYTGLILKY